MSILNLSRSGQVTNRTNNTIKERSSSTLMYPNDSGKLMEIKEIDSKKFIQSFINPSHIHETLSQSEWPTVIKQRTNIEERFNRESAINKKKAEFAQLENIKRNHKYIKQKLNRSEALDLSKEVYVRNQSNLKDAREINTNPYDNNEYLPYIKLNPPKSKGPNLYDPEALFRFKSVEKKRDFEFPDETKININEGQENSEKKMKMGQDIDKIRSFVKAASKILTKGIDEKMDETSRTRSVKLENVELNNVKKKDRNSKSKNLQKKSLLKIPGSPDIFQKYKKDYPEKMNKDVSPRNINIINSSANFEKKGVNNPNYNIMNSKDVKKLSKTEDPNISADETSIDDINNNPYTVTKKKKVTTIVFKETDTNKYNNDSKKKKTEHSVANSQDIIVNLDDKISKNVTNNESSNKNNSETQNTVYRIDTQNPISLKAGMNWRQNMAMINTPQFEKVCGDVFVKVPREDSVDKLGSYNNPSTIRQNAYNKFGNNVGNSKNPQESKQEPYTETEGMRIPLHKLLDNYLKKNGLKVNYAKIVRTQQKDKNNIEHLSYTQNQGESFGIGYVNKDE